jgi:hypothetical protein
VKDLALITVIENSQENLGPGEAWKSWDSTNDGPEPLEEEAILCFSSWRKTADPQIRNVPIYCVCPSLRPPSDVTVKKMESLGVTYVHDHIRISDSFDCGYLNVPLGCMLLEDVISESLLLHIDLDMTLLRRPLRELERRFDGGTIVGALTCNEKKPWQHVSVPNNFESCFILSERGEKFFNKWFDRTMRILRDGTVPKKYEAEIEEFAIDEMSLDGTVRPTFKYQVGFRYDPDLLEDDDLDGVIFHHNHMYESTDNCKKYLKRKMNLIVKDGL